MSAGSWKIPLLIHVQNVPTTVTINENCSNVIEHEFHLTLVDGKTCNAIAPNKASGKCYISGCTQSQFNNSEAAKARPVRSSLFSLRLSTLHAWIKFYECIIHIAYRLNCKDGKGANVYQMKTPEHKKMSAAEKKRIAEEFRKASV